MIKLPVILNISSFLFSLAQKLKGLVEQYEVREQVCNFSAIYNIALKLSNKLLLHDIFANSHHFC